MANDDEMLDFKITDEDLANEFNFNLRRPRQSKNRATYGIWAEDSDEEADATPSFGSAGGAGGFGRKSGSGNYSAPVGFVSAGIQKVGWNFELETMETSNVFSICTLSKYEILLIDS